MYRAPKRPKIIAHFRWGRVFMWPASWADLKLQLVEYWKGRHLLSAFRHIPAKELNGTVAQNAYYDEVLRIEELPKPKGMSDILWQTKVEGMIADIDVTNVRASLLDYIQNWFWGFWVICLLVDMLQAWVIGMPEAEYQPDYPLYI